MSTDFPGRGKVAILKTHPETVIEDYVRLMDLAGFREALPKDKETEQADEGLEIDLEQLIERCKTVLGERVVEVRESRLLTDSPCRLVSPGDAPDRDMQRVRRLLNQDFEVPQKIRS